MSQERKVAIVTGASSGIGRETALAFARRGYAVVLAARRQQRLQEVADACADAGGEGLPVPTDVVDPPQVFELVARSAERFGHVDVMVNNAGIGGYARTHETEESDMRRIFEVNYFGAWHGCKAVAPLMIRRRSGHIFNVASVIGRRGTPLHGAYCASKAALIQLTESMRVELMGHGIHATAVLPGLTKTEFFDDSDGASARRSSFVKLRTMMHPRTVGERIAATTGRRRAELVFTPGGRILTLLGPLLPGLTDRLMKVYHDDLLRRSAGKN